MQADILERHAPGKRVYPKRVSRVRISVAPQREALIINTIVGAFFFIGYGQVLMRNGNNKSEKTCKNSGGYSLVSLYNIGIEPRDSICDGSSALICGVTSTRFPFFEKACPTRCKM